MPKGIYIDESHTRILLKKMLAMRTTQQCRADGISIMTPLYYLCNLIQLNLKWPGAVDALHEMLDEDGICKRGGGFVNSFVPTWVQQLSDDPMCATSNRNAWLQHRIDLLK